ncbi:MAG: O-antigen ligase family protein [Candidatus Moraniibacteriota bacterium]
MVYFLSLFSLILLPLQFAIPVAGGWDIPVARLLAVLIVVIFLITKFSQRCWFLPPPIFFGAVTSFLGVSVASLLWAAQPALAFPKIFFLLNLFPLLLVWFDQFSQTRGQAEKLTRGLVFSAVTAALVGIGIFLSQFLFGVSEVFHFVVDRMLPFFLGQELGGLVARYPSLLVNIDGQTLLRATAFFPDPHVAAFFFGMSGFLALGLARKERKSVYVFAAAMLFLADILSFSRGGYVGLIAGSLAYIFFTQPNLLAKHTRPFIGWTLLIVLILGTIGQSVFSRFATSFSFEDTSSTERLILWQEALSASTEHPLIGVGIGNYLSSARPLYQAGTPFYAHNVYLDIAVELGLIGLLSFLLIFYIAFNQSFRTRRSNPFAPAIASALVLYLAHSVFETALFSLHVTIVLVFILALAMSLEPQEA